MDSVVTPAPGGAWDGEWRTCETPEGCPGLLTAALVWESEQEEDVELLGGIQSVVAKGK